METNRYRKSAQLAPPSPPFRVYGSPSQFRRDSVAARRQQSQPVIVIDLSSSEIQRKRDRATKRELRVHGEPLPCFAPGDFMTCEYTIDVPAVLKVHSFEASVVWHTSGKGDEDIGVHFFERRLTRSLPDGYLKQPQRLSTVLPKTPLSYEGAIFQICWSVRVRLFMDDNSQVTKDEPFRLGGAAICASENSTA